MIYLNSVQCVAQGKKQWRAAIFLSLLSIAVQICNKKLDKPNPRRNMTKLAGETTDNGC